MSSAPYRLQAGRPGPRQHSSLTCGSACLTVARMLIDARLTAWILYGEGAPAGSPDLRTASERFAAYEYAVLARTNASRPRPRQRRVPWPRALGTPPWGALDELEHGASLPGTVYETAVMRHLDRAGLETAVTRVLRRVGIGAPALLYVGSGLLPRHVTLVLVAEEASGPLLYDPGRGSVDIASVEKLVSSRLRISGWDQPWFTIHPIGQRRVRAAEVWATRARSRLRAETVPSAPPATAQACTRT